MKPYILMSYTMSDSSCYIWSKCRCSRRPLWETEHDPDVGQGSSDGHSCWRRQRSRTGWRHKSDHILSMNGRCCSIAMGWQIFLLDRSVRNDFRLYLQCESYVAKHYTELWHWKHCQLQVQPCDFYGMFQNCEVTLWCNSSRYPGSQWVHSSTDNRLLCEDVKIVMLWTIWSQNAQTVTTDGILGPTDYWFHRNRTQV